MFNVILYQPEIPPNTGNIIRLCANSGAALHLIKPLGFELSEPKLKRAGLDYREWADVKVHDSVDDCLAGLNAERVFAFSSRGVTRHTVPRYQAGDSFIFGPETRGLPAEFLASLPEAHRLRIPMRTGNRSLNLSNAVAVAVYEAWRQLDFRAD
ncbi:MAG: tRNA (cytidine(34)-2'-O)-methyltransferase [Gammaproteobacteria bacterium]|nr:tRNA (cytidine(34)-2'-O)-methyltransferase [Gammaproteobacteria bacterium]